MSAISRIMNFTSSPNQLDGARTFTGLITFSGGISVTGGTVNATVNTTTSGTVAITVTSATALVVENASGTDVLVVDTSTPKVTVSGGQLFTANGSATAPGLVVGSDSDTGLFFIAANELGISIGGTARVAFPTTGVIVSSNLFIAWSSGTAGSAGGDTFLYRDAAAVLQMGADSATPIAQTFKGPDGSGTDIAGGNITFGGGRGTGTGAGGSITFSTAPAGSTGSSQNALVAAVTIASTGVVTIAGDLAVNGGDLTTTATTFNLLNATATTVNAFGAATVVGLGAASIVVTLGSNATINGGAAANDDLTLQGTSHATRTTSYVLLQPNGGNVGIGTTTPATNLHVVGTNTAVRIEGSGHGRIEVIDTGAPTNNQAYQLVSDGGAFEFRRANDAVSSVLATPLVIKSDNIGIGTTSPDRLLHPELADAVTNVVSYPVRITHITSGTPANSIGVGLEFEQETTADNNEIIATIEAVVTDVTATSEDADVVFKVMAAGAAAAEQFRIASDGGLFAQTLLQQSFAGLVVEYDTTSKEIYAETSALRFKADIQPFVAPDVFALSPRSWTDKATGRFEFGLIAEEVAQAFPELVVYDADGVPLGVKYHKLAVAMLGELKRQRERIAMLEDRLH